MAEKHGDLLAQKVSQRIAHYLANEAALSSVPAAEKDTGRLFLCLAEDSLWVYNGTAFVPLSVGGGLGPLHVQTWTDPAAASTTALKTATATVASTVTILAAALSAGGKNALAAYPRNITFTTAGGTASDAPATATITGTDIDDNALTETVTLSQTAATASGVKAFKTITSIAYPAADGTGATVAIGIGNVFGLAKKAKTRAGTVAVIKEHAAGAIVTNGTFVVPATGAPYGTYSPNTAPDGSNDYCVIFERDLS